MSTSEERHTVSVWKTWEESPQSWRLSKKDTTAKHKTKVGDQIEAWVTDRI